MRKIAAYVLLSILTLTAPVLTYAKAPMSPEARAAQKRTKKQQKSMKKYAKSQQKAMTKAQKKQMKRLRSGH